MMGTLAGEKRKNDERRLFPWWLLLVGFAAGVLLTLGLQLGRGDTVTVYSAEALPDGFALTATQIIHEATLRAQGMLNSQAGTLDSLFADATRLVQTATAVVQQATQGAPNSGG